MGELEYMKAVCIGGPRDGAEFYVTVPAQNDARIYAKDSNGRLWKCLYRRDPDSEGESVVFAEEEFTGLEPRTALLSRALAGKRPLRYLAVEEAPPWDRG